MAAPKTVPTDADVNAFINAIENADRREDTRAVVAIMERITGSPPVMWGDSIIGFDTYHYKYASGREGDWPLSAVSPRKTALTIYVMAGFSKYPKLMANLGKYKIGSSCLYLKKLSDADPAVLENLITRSVEHMKTAYSQ